jgi:hypothetical protein
MLFFRGLPRIGFSEWTLLEAVRAAQRTDRSECSVQFVDAPGAVSSGRLSMKSPMAGPQPKEKTMKTMSKADLWRVNNRRLDGLTAEIRRKIGAAETEVRRGYAAIEDIRQAQRQRRTLRQNL